MQTTETKPLVKPLPKQPAAVKPGADLNPPTDKSRGKPPADTHNENTTEADLVLNRDLNSANDI